MFSKKPLPLPLIICVFALVFELSLSHANDEHKLAFNLPGANGENINLQAGESKIHVICFLGNECPLARLYAKRLTQLQNKFESQNVRFVGVNSNQQDSLDECKSFVEELQIEFEFAKDYDNGIADNYGATRTPEVFVLDSELNIKYQGRIDDQYSPGTNRTVATKSFLRDAISELLSNKSVSIPRTQAEGCLIGRKKNISDSPTVTYSKQISRLLQEQCIECHRDGEIGPFSLESFDEAVGWAEMMVEVVNNERMPPWHATGQHAEFSNERHLTSNEKQLFRDWLKQGAPFGNQEELPRPLEFTEGWRLPRTPDVVVSMREKPYVVPATGTVEYQYFVVDPKLEEDTWVTAAEVVPGNRSVVHHSIVFIRPPDDAKFKGMGWLAAYVPGQSNPFYKPTHARFIPAGSKLVFQQHYTPTGTEETDTTKIGLVFGDEAKITHEVYTLAGLNQQFEIPPNTKSHLVKSKLKRFAKNSSLLAFTPHMHYRGKSFQLFAKTGSDERQLVDVPAYDFNWQHNYLLTKPIPLADVKRFDCHFRFDNSSDNPFNPGPNKTVTWGDQTWEEMAVAFFEIAEPLNAKTSPMGKSDQSENDSRKIKVAKFVDDFFRKFDHDENDELIRDELPRVVERFKFHKYDLDGDGVVTKSEFTQVVDRRL